jgi:CRISPR-associated endonuclease/helicase Cas3
MDEIAHVKTSDQKTFEIQGLIDHLNGTACLASNFADQFNNKEWGRVLGLWHDLGKYSKDFQEYIRINSGYEEDDQNRTKTDHSSAAAILAKEIYPNYFWQPIAYCIAGHHAGLHNWYSEPGISGDLSDRLKKQEFLDKIRHSIPGDFLQTFQLNAPIGKPIDSKQMHLWIRMLFSCLVDADFLDTERFMNTESFEKRGNYQSIEELNALYEWHMEQMLGNAPETIVNFIRKKVLKDCIDSSEMTPGFFSLTVPTGGGKTLSSMGWALKHALKFNKRRIVFAIPYTSIITQTAQIYRSIFGDQNVIEHHRTLADTEITALRCFCKRTRFC